MLLYFIVVVFVAQQGLCNDGNRLGGQENIDVTANTQIPGFGRALKLAKIYKNIIEITEATKQLVSGVKYSVHFTMGEESCFGNGVYSSSAECNALKKSCVLSYVVQEWKKDSVVLVGDKNSICDGGDKADDNASGNTIIDDPDLHEQPFNSTTDGPIRDHFDEFIIKYKRPYRPDANDRRYWRRFTVFKKNVKTAKKLNMEERGTAKYGISKFMDYTALEYKRFLAPGFTDPVVKLREAEVDILRDMPDSFDWRDHGAVTEVKNQGQCGSCWAFSTTGNIEGQWFLKKGKLVSLSEQELVDCDKVDQGCNGGLPSNAYHSIEKLGGLEKEGDYPYDGRDEKCQLKPSEIAVFINDSIALPTDEDKLASWLSKNGPISIGINAFAMQFYMGGISHPWKIFCNPKSLDHGVLIVGYGVEGDKPYWIIKNSWGPDWGEKGYYRIYRGDGSCGVNAMATSAIVN